MELLRGHIRNPGVIRPYTRREIEDKKDYFFDARQIKFELFKRFGILAAAGDRHLAEFVPGFTTSPDQLFRWGVIRTPVSYRIETWDRIGKQVPHIVNGQAPFELLKSDEEAILQIKALLGMGDLITNVNKRNVGQLSNIPSDVVVETNARFSRDRVDPIASGALPAGVETLLSTHVRNQEMIVEAALTGLRIWRFKLSSMILARRYRLIRRGRCSRKSDCRWASLLGSEYRHTDLHSSVKGYIRTGSWGYTRQKQMFFMPTH